MRFQMRTLPLLLMVAALVLFVACGGDDSKANEKSKDQTAVPAGGLGQASSGASGTSTPSGSSGAAGTTAPSGQTRASASPAPANATGTLQVDCGKDLKAFRFDGHLALQEPNSGGSSSSDPTAIFSSLLNDVKFSGAFVAPDRTSFKLEGGKDSLLGGQAVEFIQIGSTSYTKIGNTGWQQSSGTSGAADFTDQLDPRALCKSIQDNLAGNVPSRKEKVNGVDATRYDYDRKALEKINSNGGVLGDLAGGQLPDNFKMSVWVSDKEKFPIKMTLSGSGTQQSQKYSVDMEFNVSDLNGNVKIDPPK